MKVYKKENKSENGLLDSLGDRGKKNWGNRWKLEIAHSSFLRIGKIPCLQVPIETIKLPTTKKKNKTVNFQKVDRNLYIFVTNG